jgi:hypothetical protein
MDVPPNGRYVTLVGGQLGVWIRKRSRNYHGVTLAQLLSCRKRVRENAVIDWDGMVHPDRFQEEFERTARRTADPLHYVSCYRALVSSDIDGGASPGVLPQLRFGLLSISRISVPPLAISEWENHGLLSGLPLSRAD